ncbi:MAG: hypothetical protein KBC06_01645 [Candidatus Pacebacteria bacterium]|nr:hypothetical protein [Candidatus Paceibacterota bacterium]
MTRARKLLVFGVWVAVLPYLGFPFFWKNILFTVSGLGLAIFSYLLYRESKASEGVVKSFDTFSENI